MFLSESMLQNLDHIQPKSEMLIFQNYSKHDIFELNVKYTIIPFQFFFKIFRNLGQKL